MTNVIASEAEQSPTGEERLLRRQEHPPRNDRGNVFDIAIIGAGVVGSAIARELSRYQLSVALVEANPDAGMGTSKASTAIWHTGFDATPGSLETRLMRRSYALMDQFMPEANIPHERLGAILVAWNQDQFDSLPGLLKKAHENGVTDVEIISAKEIYRREPYINKGALGGLLVPGEGILCTFTVPLACATQAVINGVALKLNFQVTNISTKDEVHVVSSKDESISARWVVNAAGLSSDEINAHFGQHQFQVTPRRGQLIVYDKMTRSLVNHVLLPVPTAKTKGVLISPTVYGNVLLGPTAEDLTDKTATQTTTDGLNLVLAKGRDILPQLLEEEVTATYSGLRAATQHSDYQIEMHAQQKYLCVGGIRSTGVSAALGIAEYAVELLKDAGLDLKLKNDFKRVTMPYIGQAGIRPYQNAEMIARDPTYGEIVCHCERVSRGELRDAMDAPIPATTLDGLRRRTRASQGRCQGFNCHAALNVILLEGHQDGVSEQSERRISAMTTETLRSQRTFPQSDKMTVDVLIIGAGPAGLAAAIGLKKMGIRDVLVVDRESEAGGMPRLCHHTGFGRADLYRMYSGPRYAKYYRELAEKAGVEICTSTTITDWKSIAEDGDESRKLGFTSPKGLGEIEARAILLANGVRERPRSARLIPGTRPQGIFTTGSLQRFVYQEHLPVGKRAVIVGAELISLSALLTVMHAGAKCEMMVTELPRHQIYFPYLPMKWALADILTRTPIVANTRVTNIFGQRRVEAIELTYTNGQTEIVECDTLIFTGDWIPEHEMARLGGLVIDEGTRGPQVDAEFRSSVKGVFAAGNLLRGVATADHCALEGQRAARSITRYLKNPEWPATRLEIQNETPIRWVCPNVVHPVQSDSARPFSFQLSEFRKNAQVQVFQGDSVLYTQTFRQLIVNEIMVLNGDWVSKVNPNGGAITMSLRGGASPTKQSPNYRGDCFTRNARNDII
jgi:glycerol-3-phosphate dehydrogenase